MPADGRPAADSIVARSANALNIDASTLRPTWPTSGGRGAAATAVATLASAKVRPHRRTESQVHVESTKVLKYTSALHCTALLHFRTALAHFRTALHLEVRKVQKVQCSAVQCGALLT